MVRRSGWVCVGLFVLTAGCGGEGIESEGELASVEQPVQTTGRGQHFDYVRSVSRVDRATAFVEVPLGLPDFDGAPVRGTCGVTFVTPRYAVTAAHCVPQTRVTPTTNLNVRRVYITAATDAALAGAEAVSGVFPDYVHDQLTAAEGYSMTTWANCRLVTRCQRAGAPASEQWGNYNCPPGADADIAMLRCPSRSLSSDWLPVATTDPETGPGIDMRWYHEVLNFPDDIPPGPLDDMEQHYTALKSIFATSPNYSQQYHYLGTPKNQLLPLKSLPWPTVVERRRIGVDTTDNTIVYTDMFGCHGTSGTGILKTTIDGPELLGPTSKGQGMQSEGGLHDLLCHPPARINPGQRLLAYTRLARTQAATYVARNDLAELPRIDGIEWQNVSTVTGTPMHIAVCNDGTQFIYRSSGAILRSTTGGVSWTSYTPSGSPIPTGVRGFACGGGQLWYLTSDRHLFRMNAGAYAAPVAVGFPFAADDIAASEDTTLDFPLLFARNVDNTLWRSQTGGDGSWTHIGTTPATARMASTRTFLLAATPGGSISHSRTSPIAWTTFAGIPAMRDIAMASMSQRDVDMYVVRLDTDGRVWVGTVRYEFGT